MFRKKFLLILFLLLLSACAGRPTRLIFTDTPIATSRPEHSAIPRLTATGTATTTLEPNRPITSTPAATPTIDTTPTAIVASLISTVQPHQTRMTSPDRQWEARFLIYDCTKVVPDEWYENAYEVLQIIHLSDGHAYLAADQLQYCGGVGSFGLGRIAWSADSRFFYFTTAREGVPDGSGGIGWRRPTLRFDTTTAEVDAMENGAMSTDKQKIASIKSAHNEAIHGCNAKEMVVQTLNGEILFRSPIEIDQKDCIQGWSTYIAWAASGEDLVYLGTSCKQPMDCQTNVYRVNLLKGEKTTLLQGHQPFFVEVSWTDSNHLLLLDQNFMHWNYTLSTGQLEKQAK